MKKICIIFFVAYQIFSYTPPIGIPDPGFGIDIEHTVYSDSTYDYGSGAEAYKSSNCGIYTHYIDVNHPSATDSDNPFGTVDVPRSSVPFNVPPGSVVEIHGGPYTGANDADKASFVSYSDNDHPTFFRGCSNPDSFPTIQRDAVRVYGKNVILENMIFNYVSKIKITSMIVDSTILRVAIRNCQFPGNSTDEGTKNCVGVEGSATDQDVDSVVVYRCNFHDRGVWDGEAENDYCAMAVSGDDCHYIWMLEDTAYHMGGDGIRTGNNNPPYTSSHTFVGGCYFHHNYENAVDIKITDYVVVSSNHFLGFNSSQNGEAFVVHYLPKSVWVINNIIDSSLYGISSSGVYDTLYVSGNIIKNCNVGIRWWSSGFIDIRDNIITKCNGGILQISGSDGVNIVNNIITDIDVSDETYGRHIDVAGTDLTEAALLDYNLIWNSNDSFSMDWGGSDCYTLSDLQTASEKCQNCLSEFPGYSDSASENYYPIEGSPTIDAGTINVNYGRFLNAIGISMQFDLLDNERPNGDPDIGAYEYTLEIPEEFIIINGTITTIR